jgi:branched-subunit amino acid ABC-type transport system permease component
MNSITEGPRVAKNRTASGDSKVPGSNQIWKEAFGLAVAGGLTFWAANFAISRTSIAAEYRSALSISYNLMLLEALIGGLLIGLLISFILLRFYDKIPAKNPILKSILMSVLVLVVITLTIGNPSTFNQSPDVWRYFIIGTVFNLIRMLALGFAIGYGRKIQNSRIHQEVSQ